MINERWGHASESECHPSRWLITTSSILSLPSPTFSLPCSDARTLPSVRYHRQYKWIWLNRGDGSASVQNTTIRDTRFYDEKYANVPPRRADEHLRRG